MQFPNIFILVFLIILNGEALLADKTKKSTKGAHNLFRRIFKWVPVILKSIDEGIVITVSKTGLAWSFLFFLVGYTSYEYKNSPTMYKDILKSIIAMWPLFVVILSFGVSITMIFEKYIGENITEEQNIKRWKIVSGFVFLGGFLFLWISSQWNIKVLGIMIFIYLLVFGTLFRKYQIK